MKVGSWTHCEIDKRKKIWSFPGYYSWFIFYSLMSNQSMAAQLLTGVNFVHSPDEIDLNISLFP